MKVVTLQIAWHEREPVYSVEFCGNELITSGADKYVKVFMARHQHAAHKLLKAFFIYMFDKISLFFLQVWKVRLLRALKNAPVNYRYSAILLDPEAALQGNYPKPKLRIYMKHRI